MALHAKKEQVPQRQTVQSGPTGEGSMVVQKGYFGADQLCARRGDLVFRGGERLSLQER